MGNTGKKTGRGPASFGSEEKGCKKLAFNRRIQVSNSGSHRDTRNEATAVRCGSCLEVTRASFEPVQRVDLAWNRSRRRTTSRCRPTPGADRFENTICCIGSKESILRGAQSDVNSKRSCGLRCEEAKFNLTKTEHGRRLRLEDAACRARLPELVTGMDAGLHSRPQVEVKWHSRRILEATGNIRGGCEDAGAPKLDDGTPVADREAPVEAEIGAARCSASEIVASSRAWRRGRAAAGGGREHAGLHEQHELVLGAMASMDNQKGNGITGH
jgi:hypothetical protein